MAKQTTATEPEELVINGSGTRMLTLTPALKSARIVFIRAAGEEEWRAIPRSDHRLEQKGTRLVLTNRPSGIATRWPKGEATVKVVP